MKKYYQVYLDHNFKPLSDDFIRIEIYNHKWSQIPIIAEEIDGAYYELISGMKIVYSNDGYIQI